MDGVTGYHHHPIGPGHFHQLGFGPAQNERQAIMLGHLRKGGKARLAQQGVEFGHAVLTQQEHGGHVERTGQGFGGGYGSVILFVKVLRGESPQVHRDVRQQGARQDHALLQGRLVQKRLQDAARGAGRGRNVHLPAGPFPQRRGISHIGDDLPRGIVDDHGRHVGDALPGQVVGAAVHRGFHGFLERQLQAAAGTDALGTVLYIMRSPGWQGKRRIGQRFFHSRFIAVGRYVPVLHQPPEQAVPFEEQLFPTAAQVQGGGGVGQHRQGGGFAPGQFVGRPAEIAPGSRFNPHHIAAERGMGGIQGQDLPFGTAGFQARGQHSFYQFLPQGAFFLAGQTDDLHGEGTAAAHHVAAPQIVHRRPHQCGRVYTRVPPELPVLELHQGRGKAVRHRIAGRETPLLVGRNARPQQFALGTFHHRGVGRPREQIARKTEQPRQ